MADILKKIPAAKRVQKKRRIKTDPEAVWAEYEDGVTFNRSIDLYETVEENNNFYNGRQWEGVAAPHLDTPVDNILKPAINYYVAQIVSDDVTANIQFQGVDDEVSARFADVLQDEITHVFEITKASAKNRQLLKNEAIDGDMVLYSYFDMDVDSGDQDSPGAIQTEIISNTDIIFGNPIEQEIEKQPYIIIKQRLLLDEAKDIAEQNGCSADGIVPEDDDVQMFSDRETQKKYVTVLNKFWKEDKQVWITRVTPKAVIMKPENLEYRVYPISYCSWEKVKDCYHGVSPITAAIPNQILINKMLAAASAYNLNYAFPKVLYDKAKLPRGWNNDPTKAVACNGDPSNAIFTTFKPADMSEQVVALINRVVEDTKNMLGVYDAAIGNVNPTNTSAIIATQKAASAPLDIQKLDFYRMIEDTVRIWIEIMTVNYGLRNVYTTANVEGQEVRGVMPFDFSVLKNLRYKLHVDVGASTYWSEITQVQTMDNLMNLQILPDTTTYLENIPSSYIKNRDKIIERIKQKEQQAAVAQQQAEQQQMAEAEQVQQLKNEEMSIANANGQAELMEKMQKLQRLQDPEALEYPEGAVNDNAYSIGEAVDA
ncbi:MAG: hypothetical protein ACOX7J_00220 [Bacillota bacterium]|jgi:hypothetical protein